MTDTLDGLTRPQKDYFDHLRNGRFMLQRSRETGKYIFHPKVAEEGTGCTDLEWVAVSGKGTVYSTTVIHQRPPKESYNVALIDLAEGPRMMSRVENIPPQDVAIGMHVQARIIEESGNPLVIFVPA